MRRLTCALAWLLGYYWEPCPVCGRGVAILSNGSVWAFCSRRVHAREEELAELDASAKAWAASKADGVEETQG